MIFTNKLTKTLSALALTFAFSNAAQAAIIEYNYSSSDSINSVTANFFIDDSKATDNLTSGTFTVNGTTYTASSSKSSGYTNAEDWNAYFSGQSFTGYSFNLRSDDWENLDINNYTVTDISGLLSVVNANYSNMMSGENFSVAGAGILTKSTVGIAAAVPEPEAYGMMLVGLGLLGFTARRKKQQTA